jgi:hypothetical protein
VAPRMNNHPTPLAARATLPLQGRVKEEPRLAMMIQPKIVGL